MATQEYDNDNRPWDGNDRRNNDDRRNSDDRRHYQYPPPPQYQYPPQYYQPPVPQYQPPAAPAAPENITQTTLTLQQIGGIVVVCGSIVVSGFSAWSNLTKELDMQKNSFDQFKTQIVRDIEHINGDTMELKRVNEELKALNQKTSEALDKRIQDLDTSVTQIYQKVSNSK